MSTRCTTKISIAAFNPLACLWALELISVTSDFTRRRRNLAGQTTARSTTRVTAACRGLSLRRRDPSPGTRETFAQNQDANAIRFATLYNFRFDADQPPQSASATVGFFKTGSPMMVAIQAPAGAATPTPTPTATATPTATTDRYTEAHSNTKGRSSAKASSNSATAPLAVLPAR